MKRRAVQTRGTPGRTVVEIVTSIKNDEVRAALPEQSPADGRFVTIAQPLLFLNLCKCIYLVQQPASNSDISARHVARKMQEFHVDSQACSITTVSGYSAA